MRKGKLNWGMVSFSSVPFRVDGKPREGTWSSSIEPRARIFICYVLEAVGARDPHSTLV